MAHAQVDYLLGYFDKISKNCPAGTMARMQFFMPGRESLESLRNVGSTEEAINAIDCEPDTKERILAEERRNGVPYWDLPAQDELQDDLLGKT